MDFPTNSLRFFFLAPAAFVAFLAVGLTFARRPFVFVDRLGSLAAGKALPVAIAFTRSGYGPAISGIAFAMLAVAIALHQFLLLPALLVVFQILGQLCANAAKRIVARMRPEVWHFRQELGFAYPSGHAVTAALFYPGWATIARTWPVPPALADAALAMAILWALGIGWSRLALGAHRLTDVLGGYALGVAWLAILVALETALR